MRAEVAFGDGVLGGVDMNRIERARLDAGLTSDTPIVGDVHDSVRALVHGADRADVDARRVGTMVTAEDSKVAAHMGKLPHLDGLYPSAVHPERHVVLRFARRAAGVATDALGLVDDPPVIHRAG
jgi:hypothetical protein